MSTNAITRGLAGALILLSTAGHAGLINQNTFEDLGGSTIDLGTQLEWLDLDTTEGLTYNEVLGSQYYENGWRYANRTEYVTMLDNWYSVAIDGFDYEAQNTNGKLTIDSSYSAIFELFATTFGYTDYKVPNNNIGAPAMYHSEGLLETIYNSSLNKNVMQIGNTITNKRIWKNKVFDGTENFFNTYFINNQGAIDDGKNLDDYRAAGSWLVRDHQSEQQVSEVPEPSSWALFSLALLGLGARRLKR